MAKRTNAQRRAAGEFDVELLLTLLDEEIAARDAGDYKNLTATQDNWTEEARRIVEEVRARNQKR